MLLFFDSDIEANFQNFTFDKSESRHISKVLRKNVGSQITITNGKGLEWKGEITSILNQKVEAKKITSLKHSNKKKHIHLAVAPTKSNDRMEWLIEKVTEIGISSITPILCDHSERKIIRKERLIKIAISALKQSQQFFLPEINSMMTFKKYIKSISHPGLIAHCGKSSKIELKNYNWESDQIHLLVGPEGDFSLKEIKDAISAKLIPVSLGQQRLRTETASILGSHILLIKE